MVLNMHRKDETTTAKCASTSNHNERKTRTTTTKTKTCCRKHTAEEHESTDDVNDPSQPKKIANEERHEKKVKVVEMEQPVSKPNVHDPSSAPRAHPSTFLPGYLSQMVQHSHDDFFIALCFDPRFIAQLMCEGFLPIATNRYLLPKLHQERCVIYPLQTHTSKSTQKKMKRFTFSINQDFDGVIKGCHAQHGISWLYPPIVEAFKIMNACTKMGGDTNTHTNANGKVGGVTTTLFRDGKAGHPMGTCVVRLYSVEVWNAVTGELAGGELGYTVGNIYTSLTGFSSQDSAGSVQLAALGKILDQCKFEMWDLGMDLDYKTRLGAHNMNRTEFLRLVKEGRERHDIQLKCHGRKNCKDIYCLER